MTDIKIDEVRYQQGLDAFAAGVTARAFILDHIVPAEAEEEQKLADYRRALHGDDLAATLPPEPSEDALPSLMLGFIDGALSLLRRGGLRA